MRAVEKILYLGSLLMAPSWALAEDVEQPKIYISPPRPQKKPSPQPSAALDPPVRRQQTLLDGPRRFHFDMLPQSPTPLPEPAPPLSESEQVKQRIDGYFREIAARHRAQRGNYDPGWMYLVRRVDHYWQPDFSQVRDAEITEISGAWVRRQLKDWLGGWYQQARRSNADGLLPASEDPYRQIDTTMFDLMNESIQNLGTWVSTLVEVRLGSQGDLQARLLRGSGHPLYDQAAVESVLRGLRHTLADDLPPGPARAHFEVSARYTILPPMPVVGFGFDLMLGYFELMYPLKKMVQGQVRMVALYREARKP